MTDASPLQREPTARATERRRPLCRASARWSLVFASLLGAAAAFPTEEAAEKAETRLQEVVVQGRRLEDEQVTQRVQKALTQDPWIYSEHVTVTTRDGIVTVEGIVQDTAEWFRILDLARKTPGARRVVTRLELVHNDPDGG